MQPTYRDHLEGTIQELTAFSSLDMFGHLFDVRSGLEKGLRNVEVCSGMVLEKELRQGLNAGQHAVNSSEITLSLSRLEQALTTLFNAHSPFWEKYYARHNAIDKSVRSLNHSWKISVEEAHEMARNSFPNFYTVLDALHYGSMQHTYAYTLIQMSMQSFLKGSLLVGSDPEEAERAYAHALQILGPVNALHYRQLLSTKII